MSAGLTNDQRDTRSFARDDHDTRRDAPAAPQARPMLAMIAALSLAAVGVALVSQHMFDMQPCPWCIVQRIAYAVIGIVALAAAVLPSRVAVHRWASLLVGVLATLGAASALWQQLFAAKSSSCVMTAADSIIAFTRLDSLLPEVFQARASCADASAPLLGLPYPLWSLLLFIVLAVAALRVHLEQRGR